MSSVDFRLPDGTIVPIHADVARDYDAITFTKKGGEIVEAIRVQPWPRDRGLEVAQAIEDLHRATTSYLAHRHDAGWSEPALWRSVIEHYEGLKQLMDEEAP